MKRITRLWKPGAVAALAAVLVTSGTVQKTSGQNDQKPRECDSCERAGREDLTTPSPSLNSARGFKPHPNPRTKGLLTVEEMLYSSGLTDKDGSASESSRNGANSSSNNGGNVFVNDPCLDPTPVRASTGEFPPDCAE